MDNTFYYELKTTEGMFQVVHLQGEDSALFTARGKDHDLSADHLRGLISALQEILSRLEGGSQEST